MKRTFSILAIVTCMYSCFHLSVDKSALLLSPDYSVENSWMALPSRVDMADTLPKGENLHDGQASAKVDVFYIHPTTYLSGRHWNADLSWRKVNKKCEECLKFQGTVFNGCCKVYAPRYRQAVLRSFFDTVSIDRKKALAFAYEDVRRAFEYYLKNYNKGRPIIIAGHSQGAAHAMRLLKEFFDGKPLQKQLVAAYPIGMPIKPNELCHIPPSDSASQTGCLITWNSVVWGTIPEKNFSAYKGCVCVNPLTWKRSGGYASSNLNKGGLPFSFNHIDQALCDAQSNNGLLWVHKPKQKGYYAIGKSFHIEDYNLFYINFRENIALRVSSYLKAQIQ